MKDYTLLGTILTKIDYENEKRIANARRAYYACLPLLKSQTVLGAVKVKICNTLIRPVATYETESWTLNEDIAQQLAAFERKVLRRMFGVTELMKLGDSDIIKNYCSSLEVHFHLSE